MEGEHCHLSILSLSKTYSRYLYGHGSPTQVLVCMYIPALFMGPQVKKGYQMSGYTTDKDFAPTALGLHPGQYMVGKVEEEVEDLVSEAQRRLLNCSISQ